MKRSAIVIAATAAGLAAVLSFKPHGMQTAAHRRRPPPASPPATPTSRAPRRSSAATSRWPATSATSRSRSPPSNGKIVSVGMAKMNLHGPQSQQISNSVIPQLEKQTLASNGGPIQGVSGATYTSQAYTRSLQAALDQLKGGPNAQLAAAGNGNGGLLQRQGGQSTTTETDGRRGARAPQEVCRRAEEKLQWVDDVFSTWKPESPMSRLRRGEIGLGTRRPRSPRCCELCRRARDASDGWFDPWAMPGGVDPTGLVKGWAVERALDELKRAGVPAAMINAGGDIAVYGRPSPGQSWRIGIQHPLAADRILLTADLAGAGAVATSGSYERGAHLVDPRTGRPTTALLSATVIGHDLAFADALATALYASQGALLDRLAC